MFPDCYDQLAKGRESTILKSSPSQPNRYTEAVKSHFTSVVIEHHLKWRPLLRKSSNGKRVLGDYDFSHVDKMVDWGIQAGNNTPYLFLS
jgi:GH35 family endo-1,4-beta-xylanase